MNTSGQEHNFLYVGFIDDAGSSRDPVEDHKQPFQVIGGPILRDVVYSQIELFLSGAICRLVPEDQWDCFEFHTADLFYARPPFDKLKIDKCRELIREALGWLQKYNTPIVYGAIDKLRLENEIYRSANRIEMAFDLYLGSLEQWFTGLLGGSNPMPIGILICDDSRIKKDHASDEGKSRDSRTIIERVFRQKRLKPHKSGASGLAVFLFDDIYFGDSKNSRGIQLADICVYLISKHLAGNVEVEPFYELIEPLISHAQVFPSDTYVKPIRLEIEGMTIESESKAKNEN